MEGTNKAQTPETSDGRPPLEIWGGIECTINRVGDRFPDQLIKNGHYARLSDIDALANLGIKAVRYPALWERNHQNPEEHWNWLRPRLTRLRERGVNPILGLVHHGSGPAHTNLLDPGFVTGLGEYAEQVARQFPWVTHYTPVNEPLTTARFSCLYGHWYPHKTDDASFARSLLIQCQATRLAMKRIRSVNPAAQLVQTEDMGRTYSTPTLAYQAEFENHRKWLSLDLLSGKVVPGHPLWERLLEWRLTEDELLEFANDPCPPDIYGVNYYITSERFIDERLDRYPPRTHGGNGKHAYADVSVVRASTDGISGPGGILEEVWERYRRPLAVTEAHIGCTREEQLRWILEFHNDAQHLRSQGMDLRAITVWSMLGAFDWCSLLTRDENIYEPGAFDVRSNPPRPTAIARLTKSLAAGKVEDHPVLGMNGWWRRQIRLVHPPSTPEQPRKYVSVNATRKPALGRPILITGATGTLGQAFARLCEIRGIPYFLATRQQMDICRPETIESLVTGLNPWAIINTAGYVRVDQAETEQERCFRENATGPAELAKVAAHHGIPLVTFSSDLVFDGEKRAPYVETDTTFPLNVYGASKAQAEQCSLELCSRSLVIRTSAFFGPWDLHNFVTVTLDKLRKREPVQAPIDAIVSPTYVPDLVNGTLDLLIDGETGIWHLANRGQTSWAELAWAVAERSGLPRDIIEPRPLHKFHLPAKRPLYSVLGSSRGEILPTLQDALNRYFDDISAVRGPFDAAGSSMHHPISEIPCFSGKPFPASNPRPRL
ncbi:MAG TPA: family 1 glycosylhydrolase [Methylomirabilota bacterium]|nr:family 1 glycosylhydrolase [Methylomirabilota bacterium]